MIPHFLRHYRHLATHIFAFDNGSTDDTLPLLAREKDWVTTVPFDPPGDSIVDEARELFETAWQTSRGKADWVIIVDMDEHLYHPNLIGYLRYCASQGITAITAIGYEMSSEVFPTGDIPLWREITSGCRFARDFDKLSIFDPNAVDSINYAVGRHAASPEGRVVYPERPEIKLLHYKKLSLDYLTTRWGELRGKLRAGDIENGWGSHYLAAPAAIQEDFAWNRKMARTVPGLSAKNDDVRRVDLHLDVGGQRVEPEFIHGPIHGFRVAAEPSPIWIVSEPLDSKHFMVGVPIQRMTLRDGVEDHDIPLDSPILGSGWWHPTRAIDRTLRWTDGRAVVYLPKVSAASPLLEIELADRMIRAWG